MLRGDQSREASAISCREVARMTRYKVGSLFGILPNASIDRLLARTLVRLRS